MEYKRDKNQWQGIFTATGAGTINIQMNGTGKLYDNTSVSGADNSIDDTKAKDTSFAFSGSANDIQYWNECFCQKYYSKRTSSRRMYIDY
jgi:hypothetical protein